MCQTDITNDLKISSNEIHYLDVCDFLQIGKLTCITVFIIFISTPYQAVGSNVPDVYDKTCVFCKGLTVLCVQGHTGDKYR